MGVLPARNQLADPVSARWLRSAAQRFFRRQGGALVRRVKASWRNLGRRFRGPLQALARTWTTDRRVYGRSCRPPQPRILSAERQLRSPPRAGFVVSGPCDSFCDRFCDVTRGPSFGAVIVSTIGPVSAPARR